MGSSDDLAVVNSEATGFQAAAATTTCRFSRSCRGVDRCALYFAEDVYEPCRQAELERIQGGIGEEAESSVEPRAGCR